ncbi:hypothetical protein [Desulfosarcina ovata]|nr:hypothetical protein [Desulfosarcina ovata]
MPRRCPIDTVTGGAPLSHFNGQYTKTIEIDRGKGGCTGSYLIFPAA